VKQKRHERLRLATRAMNLHPRGLSLLEMLLAMSITAMVGGAIVGMLGAVSTGVGSRRDSRTTMVQAAASRSRLAAYIAPARSVLASTTSSVTLWLDDSRESQTVHASEIRWIRFNAEDREITVRYVRFPEAWSQTTRNLADNEYAAGSNWDIVLTTYTAQGLIASMTLVDEVESVEVSADATLSKDVKHMAFELGFAADAGPMPVMVSATIGLHQPPTK
jgi:hypothetical protein